MQRKEDRNVNHLRGRATSKCRAWVSFFKHERADVADNTGGCLFLFYALKQGSVLGPGNRDL